MRLARRQLLYPLHLFRDAGVRVSGFGCEFWFSGFRVSGMGLGFQVQVSGTGLGFRDFGFGFRVHGLVELLNSLHL